MPLNIIGDGLPVTWNDAKVYGDIESREASGALGTEVDVLYGGSSKQARGTWLQMRGPLYSLIEAHLSRHKAHRSKDGPALVFAKGRETGRFHTTKQGLKLPLCGRAKDDIEAITFATYDVDNGEPVEVVVERLKSLGYFAVLYTTFSHGNAKTSIEYPMFVEAGQESEVFYSQLRALELPVLGADFPTFSDGITKIKYTHAPTQKYRIVFPLEKPFMLSPGDTEVHEIRCREWRDRLVNFANNTLGISIDESGCDVNRLFFTPRHKPGDENAFLGIFAGRALPFEHMPFDGTSERPRQRRASWPRLSKKENSKAIATGLRPVLSDGFDLLDWYREWSTRFKVCEFFELLQWDFGSKAKAIGEARILCPRDHLHSTQGDKSGCWIKDGDGKSAFVIHCHHQTCAGLRTLDQLMAVEHVAVLPDEFETLSQILCDPTLYAIDDNTLPPTCQSYLRWDPDEGNIDNSVEAGEEVVK